MNKSPIPVKRLGIILKPTKRSFEEKGVFNPACFQEGKFIHLFYRAIDKKNKSTIGYAKLEGPTKVIERFEKPVISRDYSYESHGVEDPRIVKLGDTFYLTYVAYDGKNAITAYATSKKLPNFQKKGVISAKIPYKDVELLMKNQPLENCYFDYANFYKKFVAEDVLLWGKDILIFPKKFNGKFALIHRVLPGIQIAFFKNFKELNTEFWEKYFKKLYKFVILKKKYWFESSHLGGGSPPIETKDGWLLIFHATEKKEDERIYHASAFLLDKKNLLKVIGRLKEPLFSPVKIWEKKGVVSNVVFPTGTSQFGEDLYIYYGAADTRIAVAKVNLNQLLKKLKS